MACIYFRVQNRIGAYLRNRDPKSLIAPGEPLPVKNMEHVAMILNNGLFLNSSEKLYKNGCFCQKQWMHMLKGYPLYATSNGKARPIAAQKPEGALLSDDEVKYLTGINFGNGDGDGEYLVIPIPTEIYISGNMEKTNRCYQLSQRACEMLRSYFTREFRRALIDFMNGEREYLQRAEGNIARKTLESLERFMARYDIHNSEDNHELLSLKRNYYRWRADKFIAQEDYIEHG